MTDKELIKTLDSLIGVGFKPDTKEISYNPMQEFTDYVSTKEIVHSRIIANMLDAKAKHNMGRCFLDLILESVGFDKTLFSNVNIETEETLYGGEWEGRRIDIIVEDTDNKCVLVIENKLNGASYQPKQLEHYRRAMEKKYSASNVKVLCLHRDKSIKDDNIEFCDKILYPHELAQMIKVAVGLSETKEWATILSYAKYLENLHRSNIDFENSNLLASDTISAETIISAKKIVEIYGTLYFKELSLDKYYRSASKNLCDAFQDLRNAYARRLIKSVSRINGANSAETEAGYPYYAAIWNEEKYQETCQWLSVGFSENAVYFYLVSNQQDDSNNRDSRAKEAGFEKPTYYARQGYYWYKPIDVTKHTMSFDNKPDMDRIIKRIEEMLNSMSKVK